MKTLSLKSCLMVLASVLMLLATSCKGGTKALVIPHAVSTASAVPLSSLNLTRANYEVINTVSETADVYVTYGKDRISINDPMGSFSYDFKYNKDKGSWSLDKFSGAASLGYFETEYKAAEITVPDGEEFARRVAISRLIGQLQNYNADCILEPITRCITSGTGKTITYTCTVSAKFIKIKN